MVRKNVHDLDLAPQNDLRVARVPDVRRTCARRGPYPRLHAAAAAAVAADLSASGQFAAPAAEFQVQCEEDLTAASIAVAALSGSGSSGGRCSAPHSDGGARCGFRRGLVVRSGVFAHLRALALPPRPAARSHLASRRDPRRSPRSATRRSSSPRSSPRAPPRSSRLPGAPAHSPS